MASSVAAGPSPGPEVDEARPHALARQQAEEQLRLATEHLARKTQDLELTLDSIEQGIVSLDPAGKVEVYNRRVLQLLDLPEHLLGPDSSYDDVVRYQAAKGDLQADHGFIDIDGQRRYFKGGRSKAPPVYVRRLGNGRAIEVRTRQMPGGGLVRTYADVTGYVDAQQALRDSEAELRALLTAFPGYISAIDQDLVYAYVNERFGSILGIAPADVIGRSVRDVLGEERARHSLEQARRAAVHGPQVATVEYPATPHRGRLVLEVTYVAGLARANGRQTFYAFGQDITARKAAEEALVAARDVAESASRAKSEFLASISHELRTPLNAILGFSEMFRQDRSLPGAAREGAAEMERAGQHLLALVDDLIDLARIEAGRLELNPERVDPGVLARQCLTLVEPLARKRGIALREDIDGSTPVVADRLRLRQVLLNLLSNAIKYNRERGQVHVRVALHDGEVRISVVDTGEGIAQALQERLFHSFDRLGAERGKVEGAGIGLVITQRLVQAMGGCIGVQSEPGVGSVFWVQFALAPRPDTVADGAVRGAP